MWIFSVLLICAEARSVKVSFSPDIVEKKSKGSLNAGDMSVYDRSKGVLQWHEARLEQHLDGSERHHAHLQNLELERANMREKLMKTGLLGQIFGKQKSRQEKLDLQDAIIAGERTSYQKTLGHLKASAEQKDQAHKGFVMAGERRLETLKNLSKMAENARQFEKVREHEAVMDAVQKDLAASKLKHEEHVLKVQKRHLEAKEYLHNHEWPLVEVQ